MYIEKGILDALQFREMPLERAAHVLSNRFLSPAQNLIGEFLGDYGYDKKIVATLENGGESIHITFTCKRDKQQITEHEQIHAFMVGRFRNMMCEIAKAQQVRVRVRRNTRLNLPTTESWSVELL